MNERTDPTVDFYLQTVALRSGQTPVQNSVKVTLEQKQQKQSALKSILTDKSRDQSKTIRSWTELKAPY